MKLFKKRKDKIKAPWYSQYKDIRKHLEYPNTSLYEVVKETANKYPKHTAYSYFGGSSSYSKFISDIEDAAKSFISLGIIQGDRVTICMPNTPQAIIAFYALNKIGAIANMIHPLSSEGEIKLYLNLSDSKMIIAVDFTFPKIQNIIKETLVERVILVSVDYSMDLFTKLGYWFTKGRKIEKYLDEENVMYYKEFIQKGKNKRVDTNILVQANDPAVILYSGGTTGKPKGILLSNMNFNSVVFQELEVNKVLGLDVSILSVMPIFHGFGLGSCIHACFAVGGKSIILPQFNSRQFDVLLKKYRPNIIAAVPTIFEALINNKGMNKVDLSFLKCMLCGGDSLSPSLKHKIDNFLKDHNSNIQVRTAYGLTECVSGTSMMPIHTSRDGSIGIPCPDSFFKIVKPGTHDELPYGEEGEICINGPSVMMGYIKNPKETAEALQVHEDKKVWLHTGDLASMDEDGYIYFKQRLKRMIISSGYNIYPQYIENIIEAHEAVLTCTVIGIDHPYKVQVAKAFIVLKDGIDATISIKKSIKEHCEKNISSYAMPYEFEYRDSLPTTLVGKVAYNQLLEEEKQKKSIGGTNEK